MNRGANQQTARVNVDDEQWLRFRVLALEADRSIADYLGQLVRAELRRSKRRERRQTTVEDTKPAPAKTRTRESRSMRLADAQLLTDWPRRR